MIEQLLEELLKILPVPVLVALVFIAGAIRYGPRFFKDLYKVAEELRDKSEAFKNELITMLKADKGRLQKQNDQLREELKIKQKEIDMLRQQKKK